MIDFRLYPKGDKSFGEFVPGISVVQIPTFSFVKRDKTTLPTLPTFKEEIIESSEE